jgi:hypothetical protein
MPRGSSWVARRRSALEGIAAEPVSTLTASVPRLDRAVGLVDDKAADPVDLRLTREPLRIADGEP